MVGQGFYQPHRGPASAPVLFPHVDLWGEGFRETSNKQKKAFEWKVDAENGLLKQKQEISMRFQKDKYSALKARLEAEALAAKRARAGVGAAAWAAFEAWEQRKDREAQHVREHQRP